MKYYNL